jgi:hypothetical protein
METKSPAPKRRLGSWIFVLFGIVGLVELGIMIGRHPYPGDGKTIAGWTLLTFILGSLVGLSEILSRYRDEPLLATATMSGMSYLAFNGLVSMAAFGILRKYPGQIFPALRDDLFLSAIVAGFGAMIVFRSKLFTFKSSDGQEYPIGPAIVLETILKMIDSKIDRLRATERQTRVFNSMHDLSDFTKTADYVEASLLSFQNLSQDDKAQISSTITQYREMTKWPPALKGLALGFAFLTIAGEANFDLVIANLQRYAAEQVPPAPPPGPPPGPPAPPPGPPPAPPAPPPPAPPAPPAAGADNGNS